MVAIGAAVLGVACGRVGFDPDSPLARDGAEGGDSLQGADASPAPALVVTRLAGGWPATDLTQSGTLDWAHWGLTSTTDFNHKEGVAQAISNFTLLGGGTLAQGTVTLLGPFSWTDGTPVVNASDVTTDFFIDTAEPSGSGFELQVAATTDARRLRIYSGNWCIRLRFAASLDDASAPDQVDLSWDNPNSAAVVSIYQVDFEAAGPTSLTIDMTVDQNYCTTGDVGEVWLLAATLSPA
jgi:hypothetical protein